MKRLSEIINTVYKILNNPNSYGHIVKWLTSSNSPLICINYDNKVTINKLVPGHQTIGNIIGIGKDINSSFKTNASSGSLLLTSEYWHYIYLTNMKHIRKVYKDKKKILKQSKNLRDSIEDVSKMSDIIQTMENEPDYLGDAQNTFETMQDMKKEVKHINQNVLHVPSPQRFYTSSDITYELNHFHKIHVNTSDIDKLLQSTTNYKNLPSIQPTIQMYHILDDTGEAHWIKKNGKWISQYTGINPVMIGKSKPQTVISASTYERWINFVVNPKIIKLRHYYGKKYQSSTISYLINYVIIPKQVKLNKLKNKYVNKNKRIDLASKMLEPYITPLLNGSKNNIKKLNKQQIQRIITKAHNELIGLSIDNDDLPF